MSDLAQTAPAARSFRWQDFFARHGTLLVLLARWLATNPQLLILDEPTRGIDVGAKGEIQSLINDMAKDGLSVLMISSELEEVIEGADRVFVLREGHSVAEFAHSDLSEHAIMQAMAQPDTSAREISTGAPQ